MKKKNYFQKHYIQELHFITPQNIIENKLDSTPTSYPEGRTTLFNLASSVANSLHEQQVQLTTYKKQYWYFKYRSLVQMWSLNLEHFIKEMKYRESL